MRKSRVTYPVEFRQRMVELVRAGRSPESLSREFDPSAQTIRTWAKRHPHEYALLYGSPVPGYAAPQDTIDQATAVYLALVEAVRRADVRPSRKASGLAPGLEADAARVSAALDLDIDPARTVRLLGAWTQLFGLVSFELFGHTHNVIEDHDAFFEDRVEALADDLGL